MSLILLSMSCWNPKPSVVFARKCRPRIGPRSRLGMSGRLHVTPADGPVSPSPLLRHSSLRWKPPTVCSLFRRLLHQQLRLLLPECLPAPRESRWSRPGPCMAFSGPILQPRFVTDASATSRFPGRLTREPYNCGLICRLFPLGNPRFLGFAPHFLRSGCTSIGPAA